MPDKNLACRLASRGILSLGGEGRRDFLQGLISNDMALCVPGSPLYAALLTPQGKFLYDFFVIDRDEYFLIDGEAAKIAELLKQLTMYKLRAKIDLKNVSDDQDVWVVWDAPMSLPAGELSFIDPRLPALGMRMIVKKGERPASVNEVAFADYDRHRIRLGVPDGSRDMVAGKSTLLECNLDKFNAISWTKGCYVGQELTARMHYRGLLKKRLYPVAITGPAPEAGTPVLLNGEEIGEMRSHCGDVGLALLNIEKADAAVPKQTTLNCGQSMLAFLVK